jgi:hypothetical protein
VAAFRSNQKIKNDRTTKNDRTIKKAPLFQRAGAFLMGLEHQEDGKIHSKSMHDAIEPNANF